MGDCMAYCGALSLQSLNNVIFMAPKSFRRSGIMLTLVVVICLFNCQRIFANPGIRAVDILSLVALGMAIGAGIAQLAAFAISKKQMKGSGS